MKNEKHEKKTDELTNRTPKSVSFSVACNAVYYGVMEVPAEYSTSTEDILAYIREHLDEVHADGLEWTSDLEPEDAVTAEDIIKVY